MEVNKQIENQITQANDVIEKLNNKDLNFYFFTLDTKGTPTAGIANIYEHVKLLNQLGIKAHILHEKNDYKLIGDENGMGISDWLGEEYAKLPHVSIESQQLNINPADFIVIPEIFSNIMDQVKSFPCKKIVFCQNYDYLLELLPIAKRWNVDYGFNDVITTTKKQAIYVSNLFPSIRTHIVPVSIPKYFKTSDKPKIPMVAILTRNQTDAIKIAKSFYLQYPMYKWITFKDMRGMTRETFARELGKCCLAVWVDDQAGFGTFPLEAIECETPVIGKIPNMVPEWMEKTDENNNTFIKNNGVWTNTTINIPELIATYIKVWLEDSVPSDLINGLEESKGGYTEENQKTTLNNVYDGLIKNRVIELTMLRDKLATDLVNLNLELQNVAKQ
jgi:hypothetical protein